MITFMVINSGAGKIKNQLNINTNSYEKFSDSMHTNDVTESGEALFI
jgi:hypothetical protein